MGGQASSLSIGDDGQDARPTGNLSFGTAIVIPAYAGIQSGPRIKSGVTVSLAAGS
jgi:hypothetical protein